MENPVIWWSVFGVVIVFMMILDLGVFRRKAHEVKMKEALTWSAIWISLAFCFNAVVYFRMGHQPALEFLAGYLIELSLSVDNLFVFLLIFSYFKVPGRYRHSILFWGIIGALAMRGIFIFIGAALIERFHWILYIFGAFLVYTGIKMATQKEDEMHPEDNPVLKFIMRFIPVTHLMDDGKFFVRINGRKFATPLFVTLIFIEFSDLVFAVDSIPAIFGITRDPFIVYTSNIFAILGLRSMYFALARLMTLFHYLNYGLAAILTFVGIKMLLGIFHIHMHVAVALGFIVLTLAASIIASVKWPKGEVAQEEDAGEVEPDDMKR